MKSGVNQVGRAFTLIELLVVIGIIAVLVGIGLSVGLGMVNSSRATTTKNTIQMLETYLSDLNAAGKGPRSFKAYSTEVAGMTYEFPVIDGREDGDGFDRLADRPYSSLMRFLAAGDVSLGDSSGRWGGLDSSQVRDGELGTAGSEILRGVELVDQWDNPIRVVHPSYDGGHGDYWNASTETVETGNRPALNVSYRFGNSNRNLDLRRSYRPFDPGLEGDAAIGDADEGICPNEQVYFYSAGPDGDPGTREDNVYGSVTPRFPVETADFE